MCHQKLHQAVTIISFPPPWKNGNFSVEMVHLVCL